MTISGSYSSFSFSAVRLSVTRGDAAAAPSTADTAGVDQAAAPPPASPPPPAPPTPTRAERRAERLFTALDADGDGSVTKEEFTEGALQLLRNAGSRRRIDGDDDGERRESRGLRRLERRLEKAFDRVDANDDGALDAGELADALTRIDGRGGRASRRDVPPPQDAPPPEGAAPAGAATVSYLSVTFVSVALTRYAAAQGDRPAPLTTAPTPEGA